MQKSMTALWTALFAALLLAAPPARASESGTVRGHVTEMESGNPVMAAEITAVGTQWGTLTNPKGEFTLELPPGVYKIRVFHIAYRMKEYEEVTVSKEAPVSLQTKLEAGTFQIKSITVEEQAAESAEVALLEERKKSVGVSDGISAEQISKGSSSDAGDALKRVTGISVSDGKYVQVRGLGGRYSNTVLNGSEIPSPEPSRSVVPMDMFPAGLLEKVEVAKTFTPDQQGDFAGGSVQLKTKEFPSLLTVSFSTSLGYNSNSTFKHSLGYSGGSLDFLAFDDGTRALPDVIKSEAGGQAIRPEGPYSSAGFNDGEIQRFGRAFENVWSPQERSAPVNQSYSLSIGNQVGFLGLPLGYVYSLNYSNEQKFLEEERITYRGSTGEDGDLRLTPYTSYHSETGTNSVLWGQVLNGTLKLDGANKISLRTLYTRSADNEARVYQGFNSDRDNDLRDLRLRYIERGLFTTQLTGEHRMKGLHDSRLEWQTSYGRVNRTEPDTREVLYEMRDGDWRFFDITQSGSRFFFDLVEDEVGAKLDWSVPIGGRGDNESKVKFGGLWQEKDREFDARRFRFEEGSDVNEEIDLGAAPEELFAEGNVAPGLFELRETTRSADNYEASHGMLAGYLLADYPLGSKLRAVAGARVEHSDQDLTTFDPYSTSAVPIRTVLQKTDLLPSLSLKYALAGNANLRAAYSRTVARPDFRELAPFEFVDYIGGRAEIGNPDLNRTRIDNYDLRYERFGGKGELFAVSAFYKSFDEPIEQVIQPTATLRVSYQNARSARTVGAEIEYRRSLRFVSDRLQSFSLNTNLTVMDTEVELFDDDFTVQTSQSRPLQGQAPFIVNATLGYENGERGTSANVLFNVFGRRIEEVGAQGLPDVYEESRPQLDIDFRQSLTSNTKLKVAAKNLLNPDAEETQDDLTYRSYRSGRSVSVGVSYDL